MQKVTFICLLSDKQRKQFLFMNWNIFLGKKTERRKNVYGEEFKVRPFL